MALSVGLSMGKAIFDILKNNYALLQINGMSVNKIQPAPLLKQTNPEVCVIYEIDSVNPVYTKRNRTLNSAPLYVVDFSIYCVNRIYFQNVGLAQAVSDALDTAANGTYNSLKIDGISLQSSSEDYNKERKYYLNTLSFQARVLK